MSNSFSNQTLAQIDLWTKPYSIVFTVLPNTLMRRLHACILNSWSTSDEAHPHSQTIWGIREGPYKPDHYRY